MTGLTLDRVRLVCREKKTPKRVTEKEKGRTAIAENTEEAVMREHINVLYSPHRHITPEEYKKRAT